MGKGIVLGRFQPFHNGHAYLVEQALARFEKVTIAVGSAQDEWTVDNPFSFEERKDMIQKWIDERGHKDKVDIVGIEDINDPPNWVEHASNHHGVGTLVTSDEGTRNSMKNQILMSVGSIFMSVNNSKVGVFVKHA